MPTTLPPKYRARVFDVPDPLFRKTLIGAGALGVLFLAIVLIAPVRTPKVASVEEIPERLAKLILEKPKPADPGPEAAAAVEETRTETPPEVEPEPKAEVVAPAPRPRPRREEPQVAPDAGTAGRERARAEITETLATTTTKVEKALEDLTAALETSSSESDAPKPRRRQRRVRSGRDASDLAPVEVAMRTTGESAGVSGAAVGVELVALDPITAVEGASGGDGASGDLSGEGAAPGVYRSASSLAAIIRKYAAGIQFCYDNELKHDPSLEGKVIAVITVAPSGKVADVSVALDSVGSEPMRACILSQIRSWTFPPIAEGSTSFQAPFVFTPPRK
jgi:TonB family protein